jgi:hypothetical protein
VCYALAISSFPSIPFPILSLSHSLSLCIYECVFYFTLYNIYIYFFFTVPFAVIHSLTLSLLLRRRHWGLHGKFYFPFLFLFFLFFPHAILRAALLCCLYFFLSFFLSLHTLSNGKTHRVVAAAAKATRHINIQETFSVLIGILYVFQASTGEWVSEQERERERRRKKIKWEQKE